MKKRFWISKIADFNGARTVCYFLELLGFKKKINEKIEFCSWYLAFANGAKVLKSDLNFNNFTTFCLYVNK